MSQQVEADIFRQKLEESEQEESAKAIPMVFAGFPCRVHVLPRLFFIRAGRMPEHLTRKIISRADGENGTAPVKASAAQIVAGERFMCEAVCTVLDSPRAVESEPIPEGGYLYADLEKRAPKFINAVYQWIMRDCPVPKEEKGEGVLGVEDLENFPDGRGGGERPDAGDTGQGSGEAAVGTVSSNRKRTRRK